MPNQLMGGYAGGLWNRSGIRSAAAAADGDKRHTLGYGLAASILNLAAGQTGLFAGESVAGNAMLIRYTVAGDADLDGKVTFSDFLRLQSGFGVTGTGGFAQGDFNFDGKTNFSDFLMLQADFGISA